MATPGNEIELLGHGTSQAGTRPLSWAQNLWATRGVVTVRPGWGQLAELDTTLGLNTQGSVYGYTKHLGSSYVRSSFGNEQIVSVFIGQASSGEYAGESKRARWDHYFFVRIFDMTTGQHWEEILDNQTASRSQNRPLTSTGLGNIGTTYESEWHGTYDTTYDRDNSNFVSGERDEGFFFHVYQEDLYFGSPGAGIYVYRPADFRTLRRQQLQTAELADWHNGISESQLVLRLSFTEGPLTDTFIYASDSDISSPVAASSFRGRLAIAANNVVFFSDPARPQNVIGINKITIPTRNSITAMHEVRGNLVVFTESEMYFYSPSEGIVISGGRPPIMIGEGVGCVGPQALTMASNELVWVSSTGVHKTTDGSSFVEMSEDIKTFWGDFGVMMNPMTSFFETVVGHVDISAEDQPRSTIRFSPDSITLAFSELRNTLLLSVPSINACWAYSGKWSFWPTETSANEKQSVKRTANLVNPWVMSNGEDFFLVSGVDRDTVTDSGTTYIDKNPPFIVGPTTPESFETKAGSYALYRLGLGGGLDRSCVDEDYRLLSGKYVTPAKGGFEGAGRGVYYFRPPVYDDSDGKNWVPVEIFRPEEFAVGVPMGSIQKFSLFFKFDNTHWDPEGNLAGAITLRFPTERLSVSGAITNAWVTTAAKVADPNGDHIFITWDGTGVAATWAYHPFLNLSLRRPNPLLYFSMKAKQTALTVAGFGIEPVPVDTWIEDAVPQRLSLHSIIWIKDFIGTNDSNNNNKKVQAVDWAYKGTEQTSEGNQIRARGLYAFLQSHGKSLTPIADSWLWGVYNVVLGSDQKEYSSQIIDYEDDITTVQDKLTIRSRTRGATLSTRTFSGVATWGTIANPGHGNYLIDESETDNIAISDSVKGASISYMVFGFIRDKAEKLSLLSLRGLFRPAGGRRRRGR